MCIVAQKEAAKKLAMEAVNKEADKGDEEAKIAKPMQRLPSSRFMPFVNLLYHNKAYTWGLELPNLYPF